MAKVYQCGSCDNEVKYGAKFCDECGTKLEWPKEEKISKVKVVKTRKAKRFVELNVDPLAVDRLYESSFGLSIGILLLGCLGFIAAPIIWYQRYIIGKWLRHLINPDNTLDEVTTDRMVSRAMTIRVICAIVFALNFILCFGALGMPSKVNGYSGQAYDLASIKVIGLILDVGGVIVANALSGRTIKVINSYRSRQKYEFDRDRKYTDEDYE